MRGPCLSPSPSPIPRSRSRPSAGAALEWVVSAPDCLLLLLPVVVIVALVAVVAVAVFTAVSCAARASFIKKQLQCYGQFDARCSVLVPMGYIRVCVCVCVCARTHVRLFRFEAGLCPTTSSSAKRAHPPAKTVAAAQFELALFTLLLCCSNTLWIVLHSGRVYYWVFEICEYPVRKSSQQNEEGRKEVKSAKRRRKKASTLFRIISYFIFKILERHQFQGIFFVIFIISPLDKLPVIRN